MREEMAVVGKGIPLREAYPKVTGTLKYVSDYSMLGASWMKILRSPYPHAKIINIDTSKATALLGVRAVLTYKDVLSREATGPSLNWKGKILEDRVRFVGDEVAAIAADTAELAESALDLIEVEYEELPAVFDVEEAMKQDAPDVRGAGNNVVRTPPEPGQFLSHLEWGDINKGLEEAEAIVENEVKTQSVYTGIFPPACIAEWNADKLTITMAHQYPFDMQESTAHVLDIPENRVRLIIPMMPGSFGMLLSFHRFWCIAAYLSKITGKPVIYKMGLEEYGVYKRRDSDIMRVKMGGKKDGTVTALDYINLHDNGGYGFKSTTYQETRLNFVKANVRYDACGVSTNKISTGCVRGVGDVPEATSLNQTMAMLAEKLGVDPLIFWKKNHIKAGDPRYLDLGPGSTVSSEAYDELIDKGAKAIGWEKKWKGWGKPYEVTGPRKKGVGLSFSVHSSGLPFLATSAIVKIYHDGTAQVLAGSIDLGTGCKTTFAQICAEVLGFRYEDVYVIKDVDTETVPYTIMTGASTSLHVEGSAVKVASLDARRQLLEMALTVPWIPSTLKKGIEKPEELDIKDSMIYVKAEPSRCVAIKEVVDHIFAPIVIGVAHRHDIKVPGPLAYSTQVGFADVEVDTETGRVNVLKLVSGHDAGRIINPEIVENQIYGGMLMSLGYGLSEEIAFDPLTGNPLNPALTNYWIPTSMDMPEMEVIFSDNIDPVGPLGAKGIGECTNVIPQAAIVNAVYNAIGVKISQLPITPDKVLKALGKIKG
ncbi:xanthine dehydrogenase family protein molybdopterin-binding subunit [Chloroflexota bacterium]